MPYRILVVDDEADIRDILEFNLENAGYQVDSASSAEEALSMLQPYHSLIILDVMMSGMSGYAMASKLRKEMNNPVPIIFLTAKSAENDLLTGFAAGGDDYVPKPFSINELLARVAAVLRRSNENAGADVIDAGRMRMDMTRKLLYLDNQQVILSKKEFEVLSLLASNPGKIFSREDIIGLLWKEAPYVLSRTVDVHIARIRSKLGDCKNYITNRSGWGYIFNPTENEQ
ncbi:MAG: response regulator transcription factor [Candidatus Cryptobacteroides sp.]